MRSTLIVLIAGAAANAQTWTWLADVSHDVVEPGDTVTITISALMEHDTPFVALSATVFDVLNTDGGDFGSIEDYDVLNSLGGFGSPVPPQIIDDDIYHVAAGQLTVFGPFTSDNPIDVLEFTWIAKAPGEVSYVTSTENATMWVGDDKESASAIDAVIINEASFGWTVIPSPAAGAVMLLSAGVFLRRTRRN